MVGYRNVVEGCQRAAEMLGIPTKEVIIETSPEQVDWQNIRSRMQSFIESYGIRLVVGDSLVLGRVRLGNVNVRLITSGEEAILQAYEEAIHLIRVIDEEKKQTEQFRVVLDFVHDGVIAINETGHITVINPVASEILGIQNIDAIGKPLRQLIRNTRLDKVLQTGVPEIDQLHRLKNTGIVTNRVPIIVNGRIHGAVATFQEVKKLQDAEQKIRQNLYAKGLTTKYTFRDILSEDERIRRLIRLAKEYARTNATVLVQGESGTGKELFAQAIHSAGARSRGPFVAVNCSPCRRIFWKVSFLAMWRALSPGQRKRESRVYLNWRTAVQFFLMKSATWTKGSRPGFSEYWKSARLCESVQIPLFQWI